MRTTEACFDLARTIWIRSCNRYAKCVRPRRAGIGISEATDVLAPEVIADWWYAGRIPGPGGEHSSHRRVPGGQRSELPIADKAGFLAREVQRWISDHSGVGVDARTFVDNGG